MKCSNHFHLPILRSMCAGWKPLALQLFLTVDNPLACNRGNHFRRRESDRLL